jgi:16S rRNA (guanine1207-N2)-methyltransferase
VTADHYFSTEPAVAAQRRQVGFEVAGRAYRLASAAGVFSAERLDPGTAVLLRKAPLPTPDTTGALLDLGCGYGPIAAVLAASAPGARVYAVDVNPRALELARENLPADRVTVGAPTEVPDDLRFAQIWSNPPIRVGKDELHAVLTHWLPRLTDDGVAWLVVARNLGGDSLQAWLTAHGWATTRYASQKGYRVLRVSAPRLDKPRLDKPRLDKPRLDKPRLDKPRLENPGGENPGGENPGDGGARSAENA